MKNETFMDNAVMEAFAGINNAEGGPFGSVVVKNGKVVGKGHNQVLKKKDPTCHGEIQAIRDACKNLNTYDLTGCELYTTAEPCIMCLGAIMWSHIDKVYYGCNIKDTNDIGFADETFENNITNMRNNVLIELDREKCKKLFNYYDKLNTKTIY